LFRPARYDHVLVHAAMSLIPMFRVGGLFNFLRAFMKNDPVWKLQDHLLLSRGWRVLRYLHLRDFLMQYKDQIDTVCASGAGLGFAELACAAEFPEIEFHLTDVVAPGRPNYFQVMDLAMRWDIRNVRFGVWDLMQKAPRKFDVVVSTEVLEHIEKADIAVSNQLDAAKFAVYALAPYASEKTNQDAEKRLQAYIQHEHFVCGLDPNYFAQFAVRECVTYGTYWADAGIPFRNELAKLSPDQIKSSHAELIERAMRDIKPVPPEDGQCMGIKSFMFL